MIYTTDLRNKLEEIHGDMAPFVLIGMLSAHISDERLQVISEHIDEDVARFREGNV